MPTVPNLRICAVFQYRATVQVPAVPVYSTRVYSTLYKYSTGTENHESKMQIDQAFLKSNFPSFNYID